MLILVTGVPGASKTLNTIRMVDKEARFKNRPVYYFGIDECKMPGWSELTLDQTKDWSKLEPNSVLVIDEAYKLFPSRMTGSKVPPYVEKLAEHRHMGLDIILICQHPHQLDTFVRKMCGNHFHFERAFGSRLVRAFEWQTAQNDPTDFHARKDALVKRLKIDKSYFGKYKSAEIHTHKFRLPPKLVGVGVLLLVVAAGIIHFSLKIGDRHNEIAPEGAASAIASMLDVRPVDQGALSAEQYAVRVQPRIPGVPHSAPIYDQAYQVKTFPKPNCIQWEKKDHCQCFSQQATLLDVPKEMCINIVKNGWFDPTLDDRPQDRERREARRDFALAPDSAPIAY